MNIRNIIETTIQEKYINIGHLPINIILSYLSEFKEVKYSEIPEIWKYISLFGTGRDYKFYKLIIYEYNIILWFGSYNDLIEMAFKLNFGDLIGIDLPNEKPGLIPTIDYMKKKYEYRDENGELKIMWARGGAETLISIGQGEVLVTPLQIINMINLIANSGHSFTPHLIKDKISPKKDLNLPESLWSYLNHSMWKAINESSGTGKNAYVENAVVRGKTGTAQNPHGEAHSWFSGYIISQNLKKMSVVIMIENGGRGSGIASNIAKKLFHHFSNSNK